MRDNHDISFSCPINSPRQFNSSPPNAQQEQSQEPPQYAPASAGPPEVPASVQHHEAPMITVLTEPMPIFSDSTGDYKKEMFNSVDQSSQLFSRGSTVSGQDEEAVVYSNTRMLQDPTGRLRMASLLLPAPSALFTEIVALKFTDIYIQCMLETLLHYHFYSS
jgi:hypothetical protein